MVEIDLNFILLAGIIILILFLFSRSRENFHFRDHSDPYPIEDFTLADRYKRALDPNICMCPNKIG